jgi:hypothetical protein
LSSHRKCEFDREIEFDSAGKRGELAKNENSDGNAYFSSFGGQKVHVNVQKWEK